MPTSKHDKKGPELFVVTPRMVQGFQTKSMICRAHRNFDDAELWTYANLAGSKVLTLTKELQPIIKELHDRAKKDNEIADRFEQLFPESKCQDNSAESVE